MVRWWWLCATVGSTGQSWKRSSEKGRSSANQWSETAGVWADDMLNQYQPINDSGALVSARGDFKLGFFSTNNSMSRYLGIWCNNIPVQTIVWVANRDRPLNDSLGGLKIGENGNLILLGSGGIVAWSTSIQNLSSKPTVALLLDSGNLVLRSENGGNTESYIWQSFDHPSDTLIAGMKLGWDLRSADDPSPRDISYLFDLDGLPQGVISKGSVKQYRTGIWNRLQFNGVEPQNSIFNANFIDNSEEVYFKFDLDEQITGLVLNYTGQCNFRFRGGGEEEAPVGDYPRLSGFVVVPSCFLCHMEEDKTNMRLEDSEKDRAALEKSCSPLPPLHIYHFFCSQPNIPFKDDENIDLPIFNIVTIANATNNFSVYDKIEGGFGLVYKVSLLPSFIIEILLGFWDVPFKEKRGYKISHQIQNRYIFSFTKKSKAISKRGFLDSRADTWGYGITISQFKPLFGWRTETDRLMIHRVV
ncbi:hypothetical protein CsSME_00032294 [Camellia sinensis var. sinensis]